MSDALSAADAGKFAAATEAVGLVEDGMQLGLGTGSTANWMVRALSRRVRAEGLKVMCAATSTRTEQLARGLGLNVVPLDDLGWLDLTIDGADEFDPALDLVKGGGGAHLQEKIVAAASDRMVVITDPTKDVATLGAFPLPVEVLNFGLGASTRLIGKALEGLGYRAPEISLRGGASPYTTDEGNRILDLKLETIGDAQGLSDTLLRVPGVVETGLFLGLCDTVVIGHNDGRTETRHRDGTRSVGSVDLADALTLPVPA